MEFLGPESDESQPASRSSRLLLTTKLKLMDLEELKQRCCSKCLYCYDEYDHYKWLTFIPYDQPKADRYRYYCNQQHENVMPNNVRPCFKER